MIALPVPLSPLHRQPYPVGTGLVPGIGLLVGALLTANVAASPWSEIALPSPGPARVIGAPANGCLAGALTLPRQGPGFVSIRRERNRYYGHPILIDFIASLGTDLASRGDRLLMIGDLAQPRGGRMASRHVSHQNGLDVDIWLTLARSARQARRDTAYGQDPRGMVEADGRLAPSWGPDQHWLIQRAAKDPRVARLFVNPAIKRALCATETGDRDWLRKVRPWYGHDAHIHVRLSCPADSRGCLDQTPPPPGDGCGDQLAWWLSDEARQPRRTKASEPEPMPIACQALLR